ncbi:MAG: YtxH domain-containing protein [Prochloron sp. SP5CPC1]|nr:YtxH domain-containing protein [Candidatus Paraprochloron terpiosi SP5CPC1]
MSKTNKKAIWGGIFLGSAVGTIIGLLIAPRSGGETRQVLKKSALRNWEGTLTRLKEAIAAGIEASNKSAREINQSYEKITDDSDSTNNN